MPFTMPPDTRAVGTGDPANDMDGVVDTLKALGAAYNVQSSAFSGGADPTGGTSADSAFVSAISACQADGRALIVPGGTYKLTSGNPIAAKVAGLQIIGPDGSQNTKIVQHGTNVPILQMAGQGQRLQGVTLAYNSQEASGNTLSAGLTLGDDTVGSSFLSSFEDVQFQLVNRGMAIDPSITVKAGLFSCKFRNIKVLGYSYSGIYLVGNAGGGAANCTGCSFDNIYVHNNFTGSDANSTWWPVYFQDWDELVINQLNVEHANVFNSDAVAFVSVGAAAVNALHLEHLELSGNPGWGLVYVSHATSALINGLSVRFPTMTGTSYNSVIRMNGTEGPKCEVRGLNEQPDGGYATVHPLVDFNSCTNGTAVFRPVSVSQATTTAINAGAGCSATVAAPDSGYPSFLLAPSGALAETFPRQQATAGSTTPGSGTLCVRIIPLRAGTLVSNITFCTNASVKTGGTHGWYVLLDKNMKVLAVTADQTDPATKWGVASTAYTLAAAAPYVIPADDFYYLGVMVAETSGTMPNFAAITVPASAVNGASPVLAGTSSTSQTTPPSVGATMTALSSNTGFNFYAYVS